MTKKLPEKSKFKLSFFSPLKTQALSLRKQTMIGIIATTTLVVATISDSRFVKKEWEIWKIRMENNFPVCEQYVLLVLEPMYYPCHECPNGEIYLNYDEVWRYGFAGMGGQKARYPNNIFYKKGKWKLTNEHLEYFPQFKGTKPECEIEEKQKIYHYPELPEAEKRDIKLIRPPGNKQDR